VPRPLLVLLLAALLPFSGPSQHALEVVVSLALVVILLDGGQQLGVPRFRSAASGIVSLGLVGTFLTVAGAAAAAYVLLDIAWYQALLVGTALAPTDPAVVFSVLGAHELKGRSGAVLEGESGANDPVGIALMSALVAAGSLSGSALADAGVTFGLQLVVGTAVGLLGAKLLRLVPALPAAGLLFGLAHLLHGSGFLAVFVLGIVRGGRSVPVLAQRAEVVAFAFLGLTVDWDVLARTDVWLPGLALAAVLAVVIRPVLLPLLLPARLTRGENAFVLFAGLKGAVPLLLGTMLLPLPNGDELYGVVVVVVVACVAVQGTLVPHVARRLGV
jgi:cell volume regulation protein A